MSQAVCPEGLALLKDKAEIYVADNGDVNNYLNQMQDADAIIVRIAKMDRHAIENSPNLKVIGRPGVGCDSVDVEAATERGIPVVITPGANTRSVAEHTVAMMFAAAKNIVEGDAGTRAGEYTKVRGLGKAFELYGKRLAVIGMGAIGRETAKICQALGMSVMGYDPLLSCEQIEAHGVQYFEKFEDMLPLADFVSLHVPLLPTTKEMISKKELERMKKTAVLINCARGGVVNEADLIDALNNGTIAAAGFDVFCEEPPKPDNPLFTAKNLIVSPHSAAQTREAVVNMATMCVKGCLEVLDGKKCAHVFNPKAYEHPRWKDK